MYLLSGHTSGVSSVALSADGSKVISGSGDHTVKIWNADSGEVIQTLSGEVEMKSTYISSVMMYRISYIHSIYDNEAIIL